MLRRNISLFLVLNFVTATAFGHTQPIIPKSAFGCVGAMDMLEVRAMVNNLLTDLSPGLKSVADMNRRLEEAPNAQKFYEGLQTDSRAVQWGGSAAKEMDLQKLVRSSLVTHQTRFNRFSESEIQFLKKALLKKQTPRILSMPSSTGAEPVTLAQLFSMVGVKNFTIDAYERETLLVEKAAKGSFEMADGETYVIPKVLKDKIQFAEFDVLKDPLKHQYDMIVTRNLLHYFKSDVAMAIVAKLLGSLNSGGYLVVEYRILEEHPELFRRSDLVQVSDLAVFQKN